MSKRARLFVAVVMTACGLASSASYASSVSLNNPILNYVAAPGSPSDITTTHESITYTISSGIGHLNATGSNLILDAFFTISGSGATETLTPSVGSSLTLKDTGGTTIFTSTLLECVGFTNNTSGNPNNHQDFAFLFGPGAGTWPYANGHVDVLLHSNLTGTGASFNSSTPFSLAFSNATIDRSTSSADSFAVPLPNAAWMGIVGLAAMPLLRRRFARC